MKVIKYLITISIWAIIVAACGPARNLDHHPPNVTSSPRPPLEVATSSLDSSSTPAIPTTKIDQDCLEFMTDRPASGGKIAAVQNGFQPLLVDILTGRENYFGRAKSTIAVSPDQSRLAYIDSNTQRIVIKDSEGKTLLTLPTLQGWTRILMWLDDQNLLIEENKTVPDLSRSNPTIYLTPDNNPPTPMLSPIVVLNTLDNGYKVYFPDYPGIAFTPNLPYWPPFTGMDTVYSPDLTRVIYPESGPDTPILLWDVVNQREVARIHGGGYYGSTPRWSPDGTHFVISAFPRETILGIGYANVPDDYPAMGGSELLSVGMDGEIQRLTYLNTRAKPEKKDIAGLQMGSGSPSG